MRRVRLLVPISCTLACCVVIAQSPEDYRQAYSTWMESAINLEKDAAQVGELLAVKTDAAWPAAVKFENARKTYFEAQSVTAAEGAQKMEPVQVPAELLAQKKANDFVASQEAALARNIAALAGDPDEGIKQLRQALEKERASLIAIRQAGVARMAANTAVQQAADAAERARMGATDNLRALATDFQQSAEAEAKMANAWPAYYRSLADGARGKAEGTAVSAVTPTTSIAAPSPAPQTSAGSTAAPGPGARAVAPAATPARSATTPTGVQPPVPLVRYTGSWGYVKGISNYYGELPTQFDLIVRLEDGKVQGMVSALFAAGRNLDPVLRFTFDGPLQATRNQLFPLKTPDGFTGTVELIPGPAFNLLEVKFNLDDAPRKVHVSDLTLLKK